MSVALILCHHPAITPGPTPLSTFLISMPTCPHSHAVNNYVHYWSRFWVCYEFLKVYVYLLTCRFLSYDLICRLISNGKVIRTVPNDFDLGVTIYCKKASDWRMFWKPFGNLH